MGFWWVVLGFTEFDLGFNGFERVRTVFEGGHGLFLGSRLGCSGLDGVS